MKILVIQLARHGDIVQTIPTINALKRTYPNSEVHLLVRERYADAAKLCHGADCTHEWRTKEILQPLLADHVDCDASLARLASEVRGLKNICFDRIINLSFSPFSSYLTSLIEQPATQIFGYSRYSDGYLRIADPTSEYFYAQVGVDRMSRIHLVDLFAAVAGVQLVSQDKLVSDHFLDEVHVRKHAKVQCGNYLVVHVGSSESHKSVGSFKWTQILRKLLRSHPTLQTVLVGVDFERDVADKICEDLPDFNIVNLVGKTEFTSLLSIVSHCRLVVGADSLWIQLASLLDKPCLNISFDSVNFWETGPWGRGGAIYKCGHEHSLPSDRVAALIEQMAQGNKLLPELNLYTVRSRADQIEMYDGVGTAFEFEWQLILAIYLGKPYPINHSELFQLAILRLAEVTALALEQISIIKKDQNHLQNVVGILDGIDSVINSIAQQCEAVYPVVAWFTAKKSQIPPGDIQEVVLQTESAFIQLSTVVSLYLDQHSSALKESIHA